MVLVQGHKIKKYVLLETTGGHGNTLARQKLLLLEDELELPLYESLETPFCPAGTWLPAGTFGARRVRGWPCA